MRVRNEGPKAARVPFQRWVHPDHPEGAVQLYEVVEPGEIANIELITDPNDPEIQKFLKDHNLRVVVLPDRFERILKGT